MTDTLGPERSLLASMFKVLVCRTKRHFILSVVAGCDSKNVCYELIFFSLKVNSNLAIWEAIFRAGDRWCSRSWRRGAS